MKLYDPNAITFHTGNEVLGKSEGFHRMIQNMEAGGFSDGDLGYGFLGTGIYHTTDYEDLYINDIYTTGYALDISKKDYQLYSPTQDTEQVMRFFSQYQGYVIQQAIPEFTLWNEVLQDVSFRSLCEIQQEILPELSLDEFCTFTSGMIQEVKEASKQGLTKELLFKNLDLKFDHADNITTCLLKKCGYEGFDLRGTEYDSVEHGSVIFHSDKAMVITKFHDQDMLVAYGKKLDIIKNQITQIPENEIFLGVTATLNICTTTKKWLDKGIAFIQNDKDNIVPVSYQNGNIQDVLDIEDKKKIMQTVQHNMIKAEYR